MIFFCRAKLSHGRQTCFTTKVESFLIAVILRGNIAFIGTYILPQSGFSSNLTVQFLCIGIISCLKLPKISITFVNRSLTSRPLGNIRSLVRIPGVLGAPYILLLLFGTYLHCKCVFFEWVTNGKNVFPAVKTEKGQELPAGLGERLEQVKLKF
jgi:hypothetical protein